MCVGMRRHSDCAGLANIADCTKTDGFIPELKYGFFHFS